MPTCGFESPLQTTPISTVHLVKVWPISKPNTATQKVTSRYAWTLSSEGRKTGSAGRNPICGPELHEDGAALQRSVGLCNHGKNVSCTEFHESVFAIMRCPRGQLRLPSLSAHLEHPDHGINRARNDGLIHEHLFYCLTLSCPAREKDLSFSLIHPTCFRDYQLQ